MNAARTNTAKTTTSRGLMGGHSMRLFSLFGIEIRLDLSVAIIFFLIVVSLGSGVFPMWHPDWGMGLIWGTALVSGLLFFVSLLAHELSHSLVSAHYGIPVPRITLFLFGGMAETSREPDRPKVEFLVAIAGPLMSLLIAVVCSWLAMRGVDGSGFMTRMEEGDAEVMSALSPVATSLLWLGTINLVLAVFNMIPGFPMDGGRVFRAVVWGITGDQLKATRWASNMGRYFGWLLMALGIVSVLGGGGFGGLWWILIGWFISGLASMSYRQLVMDRALRGYRVDDLMRTRVEEVEAGMPLPAFVEQCLMHSGQQVWPVMEQGMMQGVVSLSAVAGMSEEKRRDKYVRDVMRPLQDGAWLEAGTSVRDAFRQLAQAGDEPLPVLRGGRMVGLIQHGDILKWLSLHDSGMGAP